MEYSFLPFPLKKQTVSMPTVLLNNSFRNVLDLISYGLHCLVREHAERVVTERSSTKLPGYLSLSQASVKKEE